MWVLYAKRPLALAEIAKAVDLPFPNDVLRICPTSIITHSQSQIRIGSFGIIPDIIAVIKFNDVDVIRLAHASVGDYLRLSSSQDSDWSKRALVSINRTSSELEIMRTCLSQFLSLGSSGLEQLWLEVGPEQSMAAMTPRPGVSSGSSSIGYDTVALFLDNGNVTPAAHTAPVEWEWVETALFKIYQDQPLILYSIVHIFEYILYNESKWTCDGNMTSLLERFLFEGEPSVCQTWLRVFNPYAWRLYPLRAFERSPSPFEIFCLFGLTHSIHTFWRQWPSRSFNDPKIMYEFGQRARRDQACRDVMKLLFKEAVGMDIESDYRTMMQINIYFPPDPIPWLFKWRGSHTLSQEARNNILILACGDGEIETVKVLLEAGASVNAPNNQGITPLAAALRHKWSAPKTIRHLLKAGAVVNTVLDLSQGFCRTALHIAIWAANYKAVNVLLEAGADLSVSDKRGRSPLQMALHTHQEFKDLSRLSPSSRTLLILSLQTYFLGPEAPIEIFWGLHTPGMLLKNSESVIDRLVAAGAQA